MARKIYREDINMKARPKLTKILSEATCYLLDGELARSKRNDFDKLTIWAEYISCSCLVVDIPAADGEAEIIHTIKVNQKGVQALADHLNPYKDIPMPQVGRPVVYGAAAQMKVKLMKKKGMSIRKIAAEIGASTYTVQKLLKN